MEPEGLLPHLEAPASCPTLSSSNQVNASPSHLLNIHFNIIPLVTAGSCKWVGYWIQNVINFLMGFAQSTHFSHNKAQCSHFRVLFADWITCYGHPHKSKANCSIKVHHYRQTSKTESALHAACVVCLHMSCPETWRWEYTSYGRFIHTMPFPCRSPAVPLPFKRRIHTYHAVPMPFPCHLHWPLNLRLVCFW
jgi:hypothetical protein